MSGGTKTWGFSLPWDSSFTGAISCQLLCQIIVLVWQEVNISLYFCQRGGGRAVQESASRIKGLFLVPSEEREPSHLPGVLGTISWSHCGGKWRLTRQFNVSVLDEKCVCLRRGCTPYPWFCRNRTPVIISQEPPVTMDSTPCSPSCCWRAWMPFKTRIFSVRRDLQNLSHPTAPYSSSPALGHSSLRSLSLIVHCCLNISDCKTYF